MNVLEKQFKLRENGSDVKTELMAGVTTFMTMAYIIFVNPTILSAAGMPFGSLMSATCFSAAFATLVMAFFANYPIALAPGMGLNAFFAFTVVLGMGVSWQTALAAVFIEGIIFIVLTLTKVREEVIKAVPQELKIGITAGIGLFITFLGLQGAGIVVANKAVLVSFCDFKSSPAAALALGGVALMALFESLKVRGGILFSILAVTAAGIPLGITELPASFAAAPPSLSPILMKMDFSQLLLPKFWIIVFTFFFVDFFDTVGAIIGFSQRTGLTDAEGHIPGAGRILMADAVGTTVGAMLGTSTVTTFIESASGIEQGGRTGLTALTVAALFIAASFLSPLVSAVPACATAPALIIVGVYLMMSIKNLCFDDWSSFFPALTAFFVMPFAYSISAGMEFGTYGLVLLKILTGRGRELHPFMYVIALVFLINRICL